MTRYKPFFHILASEIAREIGEENVAQIVSTTIVAFALSSILTGLTFFILGYLRLGVIIGFFPRHILVGCIGGVGVFLIQTGSVLYLALTLAVKTDSNLGTDLRYAPESTTMTSSIPSPCSSSSQQTCIL